jgi:hypothetical protein
MILPAGREWLRAHEAEPQLPVSQSADPDESDPSFQMHVHRLLRLHRAFWQDAQQTLRRAAAGEAMDKRDAVHRTIVVVDIAASTDPNRTDDDRLVIRKAMYDALERSFGRSATFRRPEWQRCYREDRGDGVLVLVPPDVPKARLVTNLPKRLEVTLAQHNADVQENGGDRATQVRLRVAVYAGEVIFDKHGVVGSAIDHAFRLVDAPELRAALVGSLDPCVLIVSDWFYREVVRQRQQARPDTYRHIRSEVKGTRLSAWLRIPGPRLTLERTALVPTKDLYPLVMAQGPGQVGTFAHGNRPLAGPEWGHAGGAGAARSTGGQSSWPTWTC